MMQTSTVWVGVYISIYMRDDEICCCAAPSLEPENKNNHLTS